MLMQSGIRQIEAVGWEELYLRSLIEALWIFFFSSKDMTRYTAVLQCPVAMEHFVVSVLQWASASCQNLGNNFKVKLICELLDIHFTSDLIQDVQDPLLK